jgi:hypothetical protein
VRHINALLGHNGSFIYYCHVLAWLIRRGNGWDDWIFCVLDTQLGTTVNYSTSANLQFTVTHALKLSVFRSRILATELTQSHCNFNSHMKPNSFLPIPAQLSSTAISRTRPHLSTTFLYSVASSDYTVLLPLGTDHTENTVCILKEANLMVHCLAMDILLSHEYASRGYVCRVVA